MPSRSTSSEALWDPIKAFSIHNPEKGGAESCVGWAPSKRRRCQNPIAIHNRTAAEFLLKDMSYRDPRTATDDTLEMIAGYSLCVRYHQDQNAEMVRKWKTIIAEEQRALDRSRAQSSQSPASRRYPTSRNAVLSNTSSTSTRVERTTSGQPRSRSQVIEASAAADRPGDTIELADLVNDIAQLIATSVITGLPSSQRGRPTVSQANRILASLRDSINSQREQEDTSPSSSADATESEYDTTDDSDSTSVSADATEPEYDTADDSDFSSVSSIRSISNDLGSESPTDSTAGSVVASTPDDESLDHCMNRHVPRRPIDRTCPICTEHMSRRRLHDLVWCKGECGKSVHKSCFETWREHSVGILRCVNCRARWTDPCEHDDVVPR